MFIHYKESTLLVVAFWSLPLAAVQLIVSDDVACKLTLFKEGGDSK